MHHSALLNVMIAAARKAARALKRDFGELEKLQVSLKGPANFVTAADRRAEETLYAELMKARRSAAVTKLAGPLSETCSFSSSPKSRLSARRLAGGGDHDVEQSGVM